MTTCELLLVVLLQISSFYVEWSSAETCNPTTSTCVIESYATVTWYERTSYRTTKGYDCGWWELDTCYKRVTKYRSVKKTRSSRRCSYYCCTGYVDEDDGDGLDCQPSCAFPCQNGGTCSAPNTCTCASGWTGTSCTTPVCDPDCANGGTCVDPDDCSCVDGWTGSTCATDVNECTENSDGCDHNCHNTDGSFTCSCNDGYRLIGEKKCEDIDECAENIDECDENSECEDSDGTYSCICNSGYELSANSKTTCVDIDECASDSTNECAHNCHNDVGSYHCSCNTGYLLSGDYECEDIDECTSQDHPHDCESGCVNTVGSFTCTCLTGYRLSGRTQCVDIDECTESSPCDHNCMNTVGSYTCSCRTGYSLMGKTTCVDIDECAETPLPCDQNCHNNAGSYTCSCNDGYSLVDGSECQDVNECNTNNGRCTHNCRNLVGSFECSCNDGYILQSDRLGCEEFNPINPPSVQPSDSSFIGTIQQYLLGSCGSDLCSCSTTMFATLASRGYGTTSGSHALNMYETNPKPAGDVMYAVFGSGVILALPIAANIRKLSYECSTDELVVVTFATDKTMTFFPNIVIFTNVYMTFKLSFASSAPSQSYLALLGGMALGGKQFSATLDLTDPTFWYIETSVSSNSRLSIDVVPFVRDAFSREISSPLLTLRSTLSASTIRGAIDIVNGHHVILSFQGSIQISDWFTDDVYMIANQTLSNFGLTKPEIFLFTGCEGSYSISLDHLLREIDVRRVDSVTYFSTLQLSGFHITYANSSYGIDNSVLSNLGLHTSCIFPVKSGINFVFYFTFNGQRYTWFLRHENDVLLFKPITSLMLDLDSLFTIITDGTDSDITPSDVSLLQQEDLGNLPVLSLTLDIKEKICNLTVKPSEDELVVVVRDATEVADIYVIYQLKLDTESDEEIENLEFILLGSFSFVGIDFTVEMVPREGGAYFMRACSDFYVGGLSGVLVALHPAFVIFPLLEAVGVLQVGLLYPCVEATFVPNTYPSSFCIVSDLARSSYATVRGTACLDSHNVYYVGLEILDFIMAHPLASSVGNLASQSPFLTTRANAAVVYVSSAGSSLPMSSMLYDELVGHFGGALEGITMYAITGWPDSCSSNSFCVILRYLLGDDTTFFLFTYAKQDLSRIYIEAGLKNFMLGDVPISYASLFMDYNFDADTGDFTLLLGVQAAVVIKLDPPEEDITLHGLIGVEIPDPNVVVEFAMQGCWIHALGIPILDVCDIFLSVTLTPGVPHPTGGAFGMRIKIGHPDCFRYEAAGYIRLDPDDPESDDNYIYVVVSTPVTLQSFLDFICTGVQLPTFLGEHGYPEGFSLSVANSDIVIPQLALFIPQGLVFNGTISWYGVKVATYIYIVDGEDPDDLPDVAEVRGELYPFKLAGGLMKMYKSRSEKERGPFLHILMRTSPLPAFTVSASGYISVLGIEAEVSLYYNPGGYELYMYGNIFDVLEANFRIYSSAGAFYNAEWGIEANLTIGLYKAIEDGVVAVLQAAADAAEAAISGPQEVLRVAQDAFDVLNEGFRIAQDAFNAARQEIADYRQEIGDLRYLLDYTICKYETCHDVCIPFLCPCGCYEEVLGVCIIPCIEWNNCCFKAPDPLCLLYNAGCFILRSPVELALLTVQGLLLIAEAAIFAIEAAFLTAQLAVEAAKLVLEAAILVLEGIKLLFKFALQALEAIAKFYLTGLIDIRAMGFDVKLALMTHGEVTAWVDVSFLSAAPVHIELSLPIFNPLGLITDFAEWVIPGIGRKKRAMRRLDKVYWLAEHFKREGSIYPKSFKK